MGSKKTINARSPLTEKTWPIRLDIDEFTPPAVGIQDTPNRCYRLNNEWAKIVMGFVSLLTETRGWDGAVYDDHPGIVGVSQFLVGEDCDLIDCLALEDCLETSPIIAALVAVSYGSQVANTQDHIDALNTVYDGTAQSIGPAIPTTAPNLNSLHDNALCYIMERIVAVYAGAKGVQFTLLTDLQRWYQDMIAAMRDIVPIVPNYLWYLIGDELFGCVADVATALVVLADRDAVLDFACCLREELRGVSMSEANWNAAIATCVSSLTGNAGDLACLFSSDNNLDHYLGFLEAYNSVLERQIAGEDFVCLCVPDGWFWVTVPFDWSVDTHGGGVTSPVFTHTNPPNGELFSVTYRFQSDGPDANGITIGDTGLPDALMIGTASRRPVGLWLWEDSVVGLMEGADAVGWPIAQRRDAGMDGANRQPGVPFSLEWRHQVNLGGTANATITHVRLLYKLVL